MSNKQPKVSILVPTYNYAHYIGEAIESALAQTYTDFELLIVDDQSTDDTVSVIQKYLKDDRVKFIKNEKNLGLTANFNHCIDLANGEYIKFLLADDKLDPALLHNFVSIMDQYPALSLVTSNSYQFGEINRLRTLPLQGYQKGQEVINRFLNDGLRNWVGEPTTVMFRKADIAKVGMFNDRFHLFVDIEMWIRLLNIGDCYIFSEPLSFNRKHNLQASHVILSTSKFYFESYEFIKAYKGYKSNKNFQIMLRRRASKCVKQSFKLLPQFYNNKKRAIIKKGFKIGMEEGVILTALFDSFKNKATQKNNSDAVAK